MVNPKRKKHTFRRMLLLVLLLLFLSGLFLGLIATKVYMQHTGADFLTAFQSSAKLGANYLINRFTSSKNAVPINPYHSEDYYTSNGLRQCSASEVSFAGIDVSSHQNEIDWQAVSEAGIDFAIIRVGYRGYTEGDIFLDSRAQENLDGARNAGLDVGVYFFSQATTVREAKEEARFVLSVIRDYDISYPVFYDWEGILSEARTDDITGQEMTDFAMAFCEEISAGGYSAGVYFNQNYGYNDFDLRKLHNYEFWLAEYQSVQSFAYEVQLWQYDCEAQLPGIENTVDLNLCYKKYPIEPEDITKEK